MVNGSSSSILKNLTTVQELSKTPENTLEQNVFQESKTKPFSIANSRKVLSV